MTDFVAALRAPAGARLTTFTVVRYPPGQRLWGFTQMGLARRELAAAPGMLFHRQLGSGSGLGFSLWPDFSRYGLLATWSSEQAADDFFGAAPVLQRWRARAAEMWTVKLVLRRVKGAWGGADPFTARAVELPEDLPLVVLTRAALRLRALPRFWGRVPAIERDLVGAPGLRLALGVGELPWIRPVTFSVWDPGPVMERFAFHGGVHHDAARAAMARGWFKEYLFARFAAIASQGSIGGRDPCGFQPVLTDMAA